jgi:hypothetical protein
VIEQIVTGKSTRDRKSWSSEDAPFGQIEAQPLRAHDEHGTVLSHFNLRLQWNDRALLVW